MIGLLLSTIALALPFSKDLVTPNNQILLGTQHYDVNNAVVLASQSPLVGWEALGGPFYRIETPTPKAAIELALTLQREGVGDFIWPDLIWEKQLSSFDDPLYDGQWYLDFLEMDELYTASQGDANIRLAVIDSGIDIQHPDLQQHIAPFDAHSNDDDPSPNPGEYCNGGSGICDEHGTAVSGIMLASANNTEGMVGLCPSCTLIPIKMLGTGNGSLSSDIAAFEHAIAQDAAVINNSWGYVSPTVAPDALAESIARAQSIPRDGLGALVVFAAGNDDREIIEGELCTLPEVLCVSAIDSYGRPTAYTNYGAAIDVAAPSATVSIAPQNSTTVTFGGTSAAAPVISGLAGWALSVDPSLSSSELYDIMIESAVPSPLVTPDSNGHHPDYGYGVISASRLKSLVIPEVTLDDNEGQAKTGCASFPILPLLILPLFWGMISSPFSPYWKRK